MIARKWFVALLPLAAAGAAVAQAPATAPDFSADRFRSHVTFLADDLMEGRDTGSRGYAIAANYVASQFEGLGLKPGGEKGGWFQNVRLRTAKLSETKPTLEISGPAGTKSWENATEVLMGPSAMEQDQEVSAQVVFVGYGLDAPRQGLNDYKGLDVRGKVVAVLSGAPTDVPSELAAHLNSEKVKMASNHGAIGMITVGTALADKTTPWDLRLRYAGGTNMVWVGPDGKPLDEAPGIRFTTRLNTAAAAALFAGARKSYAAVRAEAERGNARPKGFPLRTNVRFKRSTVWDEATSPNVVGVLPGSDPAFRDEYVVLMGHLDHIGIKQNAKEGEDRINNGAIDNAAGIATMLEAARAFVRSGEQPRRSIIFMAVTGEEKGLIGADYYAHNPTVPIGKIAAVVNLDMPLLLYDFTDVVAFGAEHSTVAQTVARAAQSMGIALAPDPMPEENVFVRSDHYMFVKQGVPAILLATGFANGGEAKWKEFLGGNYHNVDDEITQPINWQAGARYAQLNYLIARELADAEKRPLWYRGNFFGNIYAPDAPKAPPPAGK
jgi:hypothetical protein